MTINVFVLKTNDFVFEITDFEHKTIITQLNKAKQTMLTFNFTRIFKSRGIDKPFSYLVKVGYSDNFATRVVNNRIERLNLKDVEKLCELFQCTPNDLLEWTPDIKDQDNANHPLVSIKRSDKVVQLTKILHSVPLDKLNEIERLITNEIDKK